MTHIQKPKRCVLIRGEVELWVDEEKVAAVEQALADSSKRYIRINGQLINTFEVVGIFTPEVVEERLRRKNGQWKCQKNQWHDRGQQCHCREYKETVKAYVEGIGEIEYKK